MLYNLPHTAQELKALDDNLEKTKAAIKSGKDLDLTQLDVAFHSIIYIAARSRSLFRVCKNLGDLTLKYRHGLNLSSSLRNQLLQNHIQIYQAMISKDENGAVLAMDNHGQKAKAHLLVVMKKIRSDSFSLEEY